MLKQRRWAAARAGALSSWSFVLVATACAGGARDEDAGRRHELPSATANGDAGYGDDDAGLAGAPAVE